MAPTLHDVDTAWDSLESAHRDAKRGVDSYSSEVALLGTHMIQDVPTRMEYMKLIRTEADTTLAKVRSGVMSAKEAWDYIKPDSAKH